MIASWLAAQGLLGIKNQWWLLGIALIIAVSATVVAATDNAVEDFRDTAKEAGASDAVRKGHETTLTQNKDANDAEDQVRRGGDAAVDSCGLSARGNTGENCDRFRN